MTFDSPTPPAGEEPEAFVEQWSATSMGWRLAPRAASELDGEWDAVETTADLDPRLEHWCRPRRTSGATDAARSANNAVASADITAAAVDARGPGVSGSAATVRRDPPVPLDSLSATARARQPSRIASARPATTSSRCSQLSRTTRQLAVSGVIEDAFRCARDQLAGTHRAHGPHDHFGHRLFGLGGGELSEPRAIAVTRGSSSAATCKARRVLPTPPAPVMRD